jgi:peptidoglycan/LPS O-acetylase OafA/YrhL
MNSSRHTSAAVVSELSRRVGAGQRDEKLDVLRAIAMISVFLYHCIPFAYINPSLEWDGIWPKVKHSTDVLFIILSPINLGWLGVSLFLVISGFCIHLSFLKAHEFSIRHFFSKRFWRIYPPYLAALVCISVWEHTDPLSRSGAFHFVSHALLIHNLHPVSFFSINPSFWSLALEAQCYALFPLLLVIRRRTNIKTALWITFLLALTAKAGLMALSYLHAGELSSRTQLFPLILWFNWSLGAYVAECFYMKQRAFRLGDAMLFGVVAFVLLSCIFSPLASLTFPASSFLFAVSMDRYLASPVRPGGVELTLVPIGLCSYSFYLWHQPLIAVIFKGLRCLGLPDDPASSLLGVPVAFVVIAVVSWGLYITLERGSVKLGSVLSKGLTGTRD